MGSNRNVCFVSAISVPTNCTARLSSPRLQSSFSGATLNVARSPRHATLIHRKAPARNAETIRADASSPAPITTTENTVIKSVRYAASQAFSLLVLIIIQKAVATGLASAGVSFPPPLAAMILILSLLIVFRALGATPLVDRVNAVLFDPGVAFVSRWIAIFFVPNLVMLPLAPALPAADVVKIGAIIVGGFFATLVSTAAICSGLRYSVKKLTGKEPQTAPATVSKSISPSNALIAVLAIATGVTFAIAINASISGYAARAYALFLTILTFTIGQRFPKKVKMILHPLITCTAGTIAGMAVLGVVHGAGFPLALQVYYRRNSAIVGGGNILAGLLGPAVITLAFIVDGQRRLARARIVEVIGTSLVSTLVGLFGTAFVARVIRMTPSSRLLVIPRMITAPLAIAIAEIIGTNVGLAASIVALTGLLGANIGATVLSALKVRDPVVRGLAIGASAHGLGTAGMTDEPSAFPFSALAMTLVGVFSTILVSYGPIRSVLLGVALGKNGLSAVVR